MAKEVNPLDQPLRSADAKYYKSKQRSVIANSPADAPKKIRPIPTPRRVDPSVPLHRDLSMSADVYYAVDGKARPHNLPVVSPISASVATPAETAVGDAIVVTILEDNQLRARMTLVLDRVRLGYPVKVALAHRPLIQAARRFVEMAVAREEITEDQGRDIAFGLAPPRQQPPGVREAQVSLQPAPHTIPPEMAKDFDLGDPSQFAAEAGGITREDMEEAFRTLPQSPVGSAYQGPVLVHSAEVQASTKEEAIPVEDQAQEEPAPPPDVTEDKDVGDSILDDSD